MPSESGLQGSVTSPTAQVTAPRTPDQGSQGRLHCRAQTPLRHVAGSPVERIPLSRGLFATVDASDFEMLSHFTWCVSGSGGYAARTTRVRGKKIGVAMHRMVALPGPDQDVDHINGDRLDNRRCNLRVCSHAENQRNRRTPSHNTSGFRGVAWHKKDRKWQATAGDRHIGQFASAIEAALAYDRVARELHGEFARLNFPEVTA